MTRSGTLERVGRARIENGTRAREEEGRRQTWSSKNKPRRESKSPEVSDDQGVKEVRQREDSTISVEGVKSAIQTQKKEEAS